ncbi:MAG TPA: hypothetical protein VFH44_09545 [Solirubrobacterales bacterium]|nr:hypothetical protein [Solirubrobacterales bacterium]
MDHPTRRTAGLALAIVAALAATPAQATAAGAPSAGEEYGLEIPGVRQSESPSLADRKQPEPDHEAELAQLGVVGEGDDAAAPLGVLGNAVSAVPPSLAAGLAALIALALAVAALRRPDHRTARVR